MDNSENSESLEGKKQSSTAVENGNTFLSKTCADKKIEILVSCNEMNGNGINEHSEQCETKNDIHAKDVVNRNEENGIEVSCVKSGFDSEACKNKELEKNDDELKKNEEIPFSHYEDEKIEDSHSVGLSANADLKMNTGAGDGASYLALNSGLQLRRISSKDIYPDCEAEDVGIFDYDTSDDDEEGLEMHASPKSRRKQRSDSHSLMWNDEDSHNFTMRHLDVFRKSRQFCDLILQVGGCEIYCHRVVLGGSSKVLYKELVEGEMENCQVGRIQLNQIQSADAVKALVDYMYTSKLIIPQGQLTSVYCASVKLRVERVMPVCRSHITNRLDVENSVETWRLASSVGDSELLKVLNEFIDENFEAVTKTNEFLALPRIKMVVTASNLLPDASPFQVLPRDNALSQLALSWVKGIVGKNGGRYMEELTEQIQRITLEELTNTVTISSSVSSASSSPGSNKQVSVTASTEDSSNKKSSPSQRLSRASSIDSLSSSNSEKSSGCDRCKPEGQWSIIASMQSSDQMIALCNLGDILSTLTLHLPNNVISNANFYGVNGNHSNSVSASSSSSHSCASSVGSISELSHLSQSRCAAGVTTLDGKIYAMGGYNQSECLDSVECYDPGNNKWTMLARMDERRARFTAAVLCGQIYAVGGSTGSKDVMSVERYDPQIDKWFAAPPLPMRCSGVGVAVMNNCLYCVGGVQQSTGVAGIKTCLQFDPKSECWKNISTLNTGRSFPGVAELNGVLYCVGGTDGWTCLASVERYIGDKWIRGSSLNVQRRGAGLVKHNDSLYCVGGSDGGSFHATVEHYVAESDTWTLIQAIMTVPRSNVGLVSLHGLLFAVGGFSGRQFLNSIETLDESAVEWTKHDTHVAACNNTTLIDDNATIS